MPSPPFADPAITPAELAELKEYGIVRVPAATYEIGGYRYSKLADAVAEARRQARAA